jgi:hypothetical protein
LRIALATLAHGQNKKIDEACDWAREGDCEEGLECWKGYCKDREPPKINLFFGNDNKHLITPSLPAKQPDVELEFPGNKKVSCKDLIENCVGPEHQNCKAASRGGTAAANYWAINCRKSCKLCKMEEAAESRFEGMLRSTKHRKIRQP